jgi:hypothetical protein
VQHSVQVGHENIGWHSHSVHISKFPHGQPKVINRAKRFQVESRSSSSSSMTKALLCDTCNQAIADIVGGNLSTSRWRDFEPSPPRVAFRLGDNFKLARNNLSKACALCSEAYRWMSSSWFDNYTLNHLNPLDPYLISTLTPRRQPERSLKYVGLQQQNQRVSRRNLGEV